jgi:hypothetical protein
MQSLNRSGFQEANCAAGLEARDCPIRWKIARVAWLILQEMEYKYLCLGRPVCISPVNSHLLDLSDLSRFPIFFALAKKFLEYLQRGTMSHYLGRVVADGRPITQTAGLDLMPGPGPLGGPRFVLLHFDNVVLAVGAKLTVNLGYDTDVFTSASGSDFWSRPVDIAVSPIPIRIVGGTGSARLVEYGSGEPGIPPGQTPGTSSGSQSNPDPFLATNPYQEPIYETRLECHPGFAWQNAACTLASIPGAVKDKVAAAVGIIVHVDYSEGAPRVSSCSGTLIGADLFLTARHCLNDSGHRDLNSSSVTFDYACACDGSKPGGHVTRFFRVLGEAVSGSAPTGVNPPSTTDWVVVRLDAAPGMLPAPLEMRDAVLILEQA